MHYISEIFGPDSDTLARADYRDAGTSRVAASAENSPFMEPASVISASRGLIDPHGSAIFWIGVAAVLGLVLVSGQLRVEAALGGRAGRGSK